ncbi:MAG: alginate export family protein [Pseudomonadota bacterium]
MYSSLQNQPSNHVLTCLALTCGLLTASLQSVAADDDRASLDVTLRERATYRSAIDFDDSDPDAGWFWTQRLNLAGEYRQAGFTARLNLLSALQEGSADSPIERNVLDAQEAWLQFGSERASARFGRQEFRPGAQRLIGWRDGTNVRRVWDGLRTNLAGDRWSVDVFALQLVDVEVNGAFNDSSDEDRRLAGVYSTTQWALTDIDLYVLYTRFDDRATAEGLANQERYTVGTRVFGDYQRWFWDWEALLQFGRHGEADIETWSLATNTGYRFDAPWQPEVMVSINVASGDSDPGDGKLETFDALFPRGNYFSELAQLGPSNFYNFNPYLRFSPHEDVAVSMDLDLYWRLETADGVYGPPGNLLRAPEGSTERFVNSALSASLEWTPSERRLFGITLTHSRPEAFLDETGPADDTNFVEFTFEMRF